MTIKSIMVPFTVILEEYHLQKFQYDGHFVPQLRCRDAAGELTSRPREWNGDRVYVARLREKASDIPLQVANDRGNMVDICRSVSDSAEDAELQLAEIVAHTFYSNHDALRIAADTAVQLWKSSQERSALMNWMISHGYRNEVREVLGIDHRDADSFDHKEQDLQRQHADSPGTPIQNLRPNGKI